MRALALACDEALGTDEAPLVERLFASDLETAFAGDDGRGLAVVGWVDAAEGSETRALIRALARPDRRNLERAALEEVHARAVAVVRATGRDGWVRADRVLRGAAPSLPDETLATYAALGLEFFYVEYEMRREVAVPIASLGSQHGIAVEPWPRGRDGEIREAYNAAFATRGFEGYSVEGWREYMSGDQANFRPDLSFVAAADGEITGFCLCLVDHDDPGIAWVDTIGVRPSERRRGAGAAVLLRSLDAMRSAGLRACALRVNEDNAEARRLYERLGFAVARRHVVYRQRVCAEG